MTFTIVGTPITKKNSSRIAKTKDGRPFILPSKNYKDYEKAAAPYIPNKWAMLDKPVNVKCVYYMPTHRKVDLCNLLGATCDILTHYGVIADDNSGIVVSHDGSLVLYDKDNPRVEVDIQEVK